MNQNVKYSICLSNYNMARTLKSVLRSILDQIDRKYEVVLVDDGSKDNSVEIAKKYPKRVFKPQAGMLRTGFQKKTWIY